MSDKKLRAPALLAPAKKAPRTERRKQRVGRATEPIPAVNLRKLTGLAGYLIRQAQLWVFQDFNATLAPLELRPAQYSTLAVVRDNPGLSQMALSQVVGIIPSGLIPLLDGLESRGLLQRRPSVSDRRSHALFLTMSGQQFLEQADVLVQEHETRLIKKVGARGHRELLKVLGVFGKRQ